MLPPIVMEKVCSKLAEIELQESICIFYACESGSRAWGFESADSDYDVRFLYVHSTHRYLTIGGVRDVIERPMEDGFDFSGWDLRKALGLFRKSNPPLLEWLQSPYIYQEKFGVTCRLRELMGEYYSPRSCLYHYFHMAQGNLKEYLKGDVVWVKKYFYVLRPVLACKWIEAGFGIVPMEFSALVERLVSDGELKAAIRELTARKKSGQELDRGPKISAISDFIETEVQRLSEAKDFEAERRSDVSKLDQLFIESLTEIWGKSIP